MIGPGDLVVCVDDLGYLPPEIWNPVLGHYYRIAEVFESVRDNPQFCGIGVELCEDPAPDPEFGWPIEMFRKIDKTDEEFTETIRACKPIKRPAKTDA